MEFMQLVLVLLVITLIVVFTFAAEIIIGILHSIDNRLREANNLRKHGRVDP